MQIQQAQKTALLFGATGLVGHELLEELLAHPAYRRVIAPHRRKLRLEHSKLDNPVVNFDRLEDWSGQFQADDVFIALGTTIKKAGSQEAFRKVDFDYIVKSALLGKAAGASQVFLVSAAGVSTDSLFFYNRVKAQTEEAVKELDFWATHVFQPGVLVGNREEFRLGEKIGVGVSNLLRGISPNILGKYNPTRADVMARKMVAAAQEMEQGLRVYTADELLE